MITVKVTFRPQPPHGLTPDSFNHLLQREVHQPGLDPQWRQILVDAQIVEDGSAAELTLHCEPRQQYLRAHQSLRVFPGTPPAYVRILGEGGAELHIGSHASPFQIGQRVAIGDDLYQVVDHEWPGRHPETGVCAGDIDWQHCTVRKVDAPSLFPRAVG